LTKGMAPTAKSFPAIDVTENEKEYTTLVEMPGVKKEDIKVSLEKGLLTILAQRKPNEMPGDARVLLNEIRVRDFERSLQIPDGIDANGISADLENGILRIVLPKGQNARPRSIEVK
jgi:HSP20 family protein